MRRREFLGVLGGAATWPMVARAQQSAMPVIGFLSLRSANDTVGTLAALREGLSKMGFVEGQNLAIEPRFAEGHYDRLPALVTELVRRPVAILIVGSQDVARVAQAATATIPIVFISAGDPAKLGLVASLARPGGNLTGLLQYEASIAGKWLAMLKEIAPRLARAALVMNPIGSYDYFRQSAEALAPSLKIELVLSPVGTAADIERTIESFARVPNGGLLLPPDNMTSTHRDLIISLAAKHRLPAVYSLRVFVAAGGLMSYGTDQVEMLRQAAYYVDRILRGAKPADLPVQAPTKYETVVNLKTAKALGLTVPPSLLVRADEVIE